MYRTLGDGKNKGCVALVVGTRPINQLASNQYLLDNTTWI